MPLLIALLVIVIFMVRVLPLVPCDDRNLPYSRKKATTFFDYFHFPCKIKGSSAGNLEFPNGKSAGNPMLPYVCHTSDDTDPAPYLSLNLPDSLILLSQQIPHASQRCTLGGYFFINRFTIFVVSRKRSVCAYLARFAAARPHVQIIIERNKFAVNKLIKWLAR